MDYEANKKLYAVAAALGVAIALFLLFGFKSEQASATVIHTEWQNKGDVKWSGVCESKAPACGEVAKGEESGEQYQECKLIGGGGGFPCVVGQKRTVNVSRSCEVVGDVCEEEGECPSACGLEASEVPDGKGGTKVCEATPACEEEEPTCEEEGNCPDEEEPPVTTPPKTSTPDEPKVRYSQGPNGVTGDGKCQVEWKTIKGSKKVEIRYAEDGVFGNGYKTLMTTDDGAEWLDSVSGKLKIRGRDSKTEWSHAKSYSC